MPLLLLLGVLLFISNESKAQIGFKRSQVEAFVGKEQILVTKKEGDYFSQQILTGWNELAIIMYNKDTVAVAITYGLKDSFYTDDHIAMMVRNNLPDFTAQQTGGSGEVTYYVDTVNVQMLMVSHKDLKPKSPITGFVVTNDPELIAFWLTGVDLIKND